MYTFDICMNCTFYLTKFITQISKTFLIICNSKLLLFDINMYLILYYDKIIIHFKRNYFMMHHLKQPYTRIIK